VAISTGHSESQELQVQHMVLSANPPASISRRSFGCGTTGRGGMLLTFITATSLYGTKGAKRLA
jgi:hypothetical protein